MKIKNKSLSDKSRKWLKRHVEDEYVKKSSKDNYRSRAAYKLIEILQKYNAIKKNIRYKVDSNRVMLFGGLWLIWLFSMICFILLHLISAPIVVYIVIFI